MLVLHFSTFMVCEAKYTIFSDRGKMPQHATFVEIQNFSEAFGSSPEFAFSTESFTAA